MCTYVGRAACDGEEQVQVGVLLLAWCVALSAEVGVHIRVNEDGLEGSETCCSALSSLSGARGQRTKDKARNGEAICSAPLQATSGLDAPEEDARSYLEASEACRYLFRTHVSLENDRRQTKGNLCRRVMLKWSFRLAHMTGGIGLQTRHRPSPAYTSEPDVSAPIGVRGINITQSGKSLPASHHLISYSSNRPGRLTAKRLTQSTLSHSFQPSRRIPQRHIL